MSSYAERIVDLVRAVPELQLTGSRYFGTATYGSDWDFFLPQSKQHKLPYNFTVEFDNNYDTDTLVLSVFKSKFHNAHVQVIPDDVLAVKVAAQAILRATGALLGASKPQSRVIWNAVVQALETTVQ